MNGYLFQFKIGREKLGQCGAIVQRQGVADVAADQLNAVHFAVDAAVAALLHGHLDEPQWYLDLLGRDQTHPRVLPS